MLLPGQPHEHLPGIGGLAREAAAHDDAAQPVLERLDPLAHRRRGEVESSGGSLEGPLVDDGEERSELVGLHHSSLDEALLMNLKNPLLAFTRTQP
ncbi:hypothetical protein GCM10022415_13080 [Knoellia locipacati]|uniref:Uncharacterized protein n=1 Tax=Knoellia locipacati TaxID=882824 RepID=A0A512SZ75_9MICO|nr:hypothetical protein KLO01_13050 [Knoellia locipacati]